MGKPEYAVIFLYIRGRPILHGEMIDSWRNAVKDEIVYIFIIGLQPIFLTII